MVVEWIVAGLTALVALWALVLLALPRRLRVDRSGVVEAAPDAVFALLASGQGYQAFNPYRDTDPNLVTVPFGPDRGIGSGFSFKGKEGSGKQTITGLEENRAVTMQIDLGPMGKPVQAFTLQPQGARTRVTWRIDMDFGLNPLGRIFGLFLKQRIGKTHERGLANLNTALAHPA